MALPQTPEQIEAMMALMRNIPAGALLPLPLYKPSLFDELCRPRRIYLQRPCTDDMMQLCADLGIDVPDFQPISYDGRTFRFQPTAAVIEDADGFTPVSYSEMYVIEENPWASS